MLSWVCEDHPDQPHGHLVDGVPCDGAGMLAIDAGREAPPMVEWDGCFLASGATMGEPCWGELTLVERVIPADEGGSQPNDVLLCQGHLPIYRGERYRHRPETRRL